MCPPQESGHDQLLSPGSHDMRVSHGGGVVVVVVVVVEVVLGGGRCGGADSVLQ